jgi:hypothetical protein
MHALLNADEKSAPARTRKRTHEEIQGTQSPTRAVLCPPHQRPVKKVRRAPSRPQARESKAGELSKGAGEGRSHSDDPAADSRRLEEDNERLSNVAVQQLIQLHKSSEQLKKTEEELEALRADHEALRKSYEEELRGLREEKAALEKAHEEELAEVKVQALAEQSEYVKKEPPKEGSAGLGAYR